MDLNDTIDPSYSMADDHSKPVPMNQPPAAAPQQPTHRQKQIYDLLNVAEEQQDAVGKLLKEINQIRQENMVLHAQLVDALRATPKDVQTAIHKATLEHIDVNTSQTTDQLKAATVELDAARQNLGWKLALMNWAPLLMGLILLAGWTLYNTMEEADYQQRVEQYKRNGGAFDFVRCGDGLCVHVDVNEGGTHDGKRYYRAQ